MIMCIATKNKRSHIVVNFPTGEKVSMKYIPSNWIYPFTTKQVLYLSIDPLTLYFTLYTHLQPITILSTDKEVMVQVFYCSSIVISSFIAFIQISLLVSIGRITYWKQGKSMKRDIKDSIRYLILLIGIEDARDNS